MDPKSPAEISQRARAQSESIGVILLTAVIVVLVGGFGIVYLGATGQSAGGGGPLVDVEINATADRVSITHAGGETVRIDDLAVIVQGETSNERYAIDAANVTGGNADALFDPGERFARDHDVGSRSLDVLLVHTASNTVIERAALDTP